MNLKKDVQCLVLDFFNMIGSDIIDDGVGMYKIQIPKEYERVFQASELLIAFDNTVSSKHDRCELVIIGSKILSIIIHDCTKKGPIAFQKYGNTPNNNLLIRYYFYVNFSGMFNHSQLLHIDIDLNTNKLVQPDMSLEKYNYTSDQFDPTKVTSSYAAALSELEHCCLNKKLKFINDANSLFCQDYDSFTDKYDIQIRELDKKINKKEETLNDFDKITEFRFNMIEKIKDLEKEKERLIQTLQEKHKIRLEYGLVACEIITC